MCAPQFNTRRWMIAGRGSGPSGHSIVDKTFHKPSVKNLPAVSYSQSPATRLRSSMTWLGRSVSSPIGLNPFSMKTSRPRSFGSNSHPRFLRRRIAESIPATSTYCGSFSGLKASSFARSLGRSNRSSPGARGSSFRSSTATFDAFTPRPRYCQSICEPSGRNESERTGSFERVHLEGRACNLRVKTAGRNETLAEAIHQKRTDRGGRQRLHPGAGQIRVESLHDCRIGWSPGQTFYIPTHFLQHTPLNVYNDRQSKRLWLTIHTAKLPFNIRLNTGSRAINRFSLQAGCPRASWHNRCSRQLRKQGIKQN